jgi:PAS domain S-box-containing protein
MTELRDFYAALVESADVAIVAKNTDGIVIAWNPAAEALFGWTSEEMVGGSIRRLLPADRQQEEDHILDRIRAGERVPPFYTKRMHKDGHLLDVQVSVSPVRDASGKIIGASKLARDVGDYLRAQQAVHESEERFRTLAENMSQFAWMAHADGTIFWFNKRWYEFTGLPENVPLDRQGRRVVHPDYQEQVLARYLEAIASGEDYEDTFPIRGKNGQYGWSGSKACILSWLCSSSFCRSSGRWLRIEPPTISSEVQPNSFRAAGFQAMTMPSVFLATIASSADSTKAA